MAAIIKRDYLILVSLKGTQSQWDGYLESLPTGAVDLPLFWNQSINQGDPEDGLEALRWLRGTAVEKILFAAQENGSTLIVRGIAFIDELVNNNGTARMRSIRITTK